MKMSRGAALVSAAACLACAGWLLAQEQVNQDLDKPLTQFTIGDLFPAVAGPIARQTGDVWKRAGGELEGIAVGRRRSLDLALSRLKERISSLKGNVKAARRSKDFTAQGAAQGKLDTEEAVGAILKRLDLLTDAQRDVGRAWTDAGEAMLNFASAEEQFGAYGASGIAKPGADPEASDTRLDADGVAAFRRHTGAMDDLGRSFETLGSEIRDLVDKRLKLLKELERGGHVKTPPLK